MNQNIITASGVVGIPLLLASLISLTLVFERCYFWWQIWHRESSVIRQVFTLLEVDRSQAITFLLKHTDLPTPRIFLAALELKHQDLETIQVALETAARAELPILRRFNTAFDTVITLAPMLGLLGTVLGLMTSFSSLSFGDVSRSDAAGVTGGISEALSSTAFGLIVAIATLLFSNLFRSFYRRQIAAINTANGRLELLIRELNFSDPSSSLVDQTINHNFRTDL